jgi:carbon monoxide dehydrogenase subunit G
MAIYRTQIDSPKGRDEVFEYLANFSNASGWDPGVTEARSLTSGSPELGSIYRLSVRVAGRHVPFDYRIIALDRPTRVVFRAEQSTMVSTDTITVNRAGAGSQVIYVAKFESRGMLRLFAPLVARTFQKMAERAAGGLRQALA